MTSISNRLGKLERDHADASVARALAPSDLTDRDLIEALLEAEGIEPTAETVEMHLRHFNETGVLPGKSDNSVAPKPEVQ